MGKEMRKAALALDDIREIMAQAANLDTTNLEANLEAGTLHLRTVHKKDALPYFLRIYRSNPNYRTDLEYWIALSYHHGLRFREAIDFYLRFRKRITSGGAPRTRIQVSALDRHIEECRSGILMVVRPKNFLIKNLGSAVNSEAADYSPSLTLSGDLLVFTSRRRDGNINENVSLRDNKPFEDIFISRKKDGQWQPATNIGPPVNTPGNDSDLSFNPKGDILYTFSDGDIFAAQMLPDGSWSAPVALKSPINSDSTEKGFTITSSGLAIFGSKRAGGYGGVDLYACQLKPDGTWGKVRNLGPAINTEFNEESPSIDNNGKVLYFSSNGLRGGMGGYDVYRTALLNESKLSWSEPENLGYPINTPDDDLYFIGTGDKGKGYFASVREGGSGYFDIYEITIPDFKTDQAALLPVRLQISIIEAETQKPLEAAVELLNAGDMTHASTAIAEKADWSFYVRNNQARSYILTVEAPGYTNQKIKIDLPATTPSEQIIRRNIFLIKSTGPASEKTVPSGKVSEREPVVTEILPARDTSLKPGSISFLFFATGSVQLTSSAIQLIKKLASTLSGNPALTISLEGHTDNIGDESYNVSLAQQRVNQVAEQLRKSGIPTSRIEIRAVGERRPAVSNDDEPEGREYNRRVEIRIR